MANLVVICGTIVALLCALASARYFRREAAGPRPPPGPTRLPIFGNIFDLPPKGMPEYKHWLKHKEKYGLISSVSVLGTTLIILHDKEAAHEILERKSAKTSARPIIEFAHNLCGFKEFLMGQQYDASFRQRRKIIHHQLGSQARIADFNDIQEVEVRRFLLRLMKEPNKLFKHLKTEAGAIILKIIYGYTIEPNKADPLIGLIEGTIANFITAGVPMSWMVDYIPALSYLPDWMPCTGFKKTARQWKRANEAVAEIPYFFVKEQIAKGTNRPSYVSRILQENVNTHGDSEHAIKWTAATLYGGGADTQVSTLSSFILAMLMFPEVQYKAQREIDQVVGLHRLQTFDDREKLPFVDSIVKEAHRWATVVPMGLPHVSEEDIVYKGHLIPKGAYLLPAIWWFCHDPEFYKDPEQFYPERYLERNEPDPKAFMFGYGRRMCPGRYFADANIFLTVAQTLAAFDIRRATKDGVELEVKLEATPGIASHPKQYLYNIIPRSTGHAALIEAISKEEPRQASDSCFIEDARI